MNRELASRIFLPMILLLVVFSNGCALKKWKANGFKVGPNYGKPVADVAPEWIDAGDMRISSEPTDAAHWWMVFNDRILTELILEAYDQNLTLREAGMRVLEARAQRGVAAGNLFPQAQSIDGSYSRSLVSRNTANTPPTVNRSFDNWATSGSLLWEVDFWGRFRRAVEAADADLDASAENYDDVLTSLLAEVAATYVDIRTLQQRLEYARQNIESQRGSFEIARDQNLAGAVSEVDVRQAELNLASTQALIPQFSAALRQQNNLLCFLLGRPTEDLLPRLGTGSIPSAPASVAVGIPGELLRRRPDIRRAERQTAAQSAEIGIAESDLYPHFTISGTIGYQAQSLSTKFGPNANFGVIAPSFSWDVLNYGRFRNNIAAQESAFQALAISYQNTVLNANQEVENSITGFLNAQEETRFLAQAAKAAEKGVKLVTAQYEGGAVNFNTVFNLQLSQVDQQDAYAASQGNIALQLIGIYKALGGGWQIRFDGGNIVPAEMVAPGEIQSPTDRNVLPTPAVETDEPIDPIDIRQLPTRPLF
jgi:NodT family efflux transporter outer membrane factor (OMF) lipoprotein